MSSELAQRVYDFFCTHHVSKYDLQPADVLFIFGRNESKLAHDAQELYVDGIVQNILVTGGIGKDSGDLPKLGLSEAQYLAAVMYEVGVPASNLLVESRATNGGENSRFGMAMIHGAGMVADRIILLSHPSNGLRLFAVHMLEARKMGFEAEYQLAVCDWDFDKNNEVHQKLVISECLRLIEYPLRTNAAGEPDPWSDTIEVPVDLVADVQDWKTEQSK